jgi:hypothetical protein
LGNESGKQSNWTAGSFQQESAKTDHALSPPKADEVAHHSFPHCFAASLFRNIIAAQHHLPRPESFIGRTKDLITHFLIALLHHYSVTSLQRNIIYHVLSVAKDLLEVH